MTTILFIWWLIVTSPAQSLCSIWHAHPPGPDEMMIACGPVISANLDQYTVMAYNIQTGDLVCQFPGDLIYKIPCDMWPFDHYRLDIIKPSSESTVCAVSTSTQAAPNALTIADQCPGLAYERVVYAGTQTIEPPPAMCKPPKPAPGPGLLDLPADAGSLLTSDTYYWLAGRLIWTGIVKPSCPGGLSGINPETGAATECGLLSAGNEMIAWQNRFDGQIYAAAAEWNVPPRLLKQLIARETQFWPLYSDYQEIGLVQLTDDALDLVLLTYQDGYALASDSSQADTRYLLRQSLLCVACNLAQAIEKETANLPVYAQALAAYYCNTGSWDEALRLWNDQHTFAKGG